MRWEAKIVPTSDGGVMKFSWGAKEWFAIFCIAVGAYVAMERTIATVRTESRAAASALEIALAELGAKFDGHVLGVNAAIFTLNSRVDDIDRRQRDVRERLSALETRDADAHRSTR